MDENGFSRSQLDNLYWCFSQCEHMEDPVGGIIEMYKASYSATKTRLSVIQVGVSVFFFAEGALSSSRNPFLQYRAIATFEKPEMIVTLKLHSICTSFSQYGIAY